MSVSLYIEEQIPPRLLVFWKTFDLEYFPPVLDASKDLEAVVVAARVKRGRGGRYETTARAVGVYNAFVRMYVCVLRWAWGGGTRRSPCMRACVLRGVANIK